MPSSVIAISYALAAALESVGEAIGNVQIVPNMIIWPTPPALDVYPDTPFSEDHAMGRGNVATRWRVRARVSTADHEEGAQGTLLALLEPSGATSIRAALLSDLTLDGTADMVKVGHATGYQVYLEPRSGGGMLIGCEWPVSVVPAQDA